MNFLDKYLIVKNNDRINGLTNELNNILIYKFFQKEKENVIVLTNSLFEANKVYENLRTYTANVYLFPMDDFLTSMILAVSPELQIKRLETLEKIKKQKKSIVVTNLMGFLKFLPDLKTADKLTFTLEKNQTIERNKLNKILDQFGYVRESITTSTGEYSIRGFVIDIFLIQEQHPIRIEFFDNTIESIRYFDESTQTSFKTINKIECRPYKEISTSKQSSLFDYMNNPTAIYIDYHQIEVRFKK